MNTGQLLARLKRGLEAQGVNLSGKMRQEYLEEFKAAIEDGVEVRAMTAAIDRIVEEWHRIQLPFYAALKDVGGVRSTREAGGRPRGAPNNGAVRRMEGHHERFGLTKKQEVMLATIQQLTREGLETPEIVERILGPRGEDAA